MYISCNGIPPWIFFHSNAAVPVHFLHCGDSVVCSPILPVHSLESAVTTISCRIRPRNCKKLPYISDCYMQVLACIATQYMPIRVRCIGKYCGMYCGMYWWYVLNIWQNVFDTNNYVFNTYQSVLICIVLVLRMS